MKKQSLQTPIYSEKNSRDTSPIIIKINNKVNNVNALDETNDHERGSSFTQANRDTSNI